MSKHAAADNPDDPVERLRADHRREQRLIWKGLLALLVVVVVVLIRYWFFL